MSGHSDKLLQVFLNSDNAAETERALTVLMNESVEPVVTRSLRSRFGVSMRADDLSRENLEATDLAAEIRLHVVEELTKRRLNGSEDRIENLGAYVASTAANACNQYLRSKYPLRNRLRNQIRYLLTHKPEFSLWEQDGSFVCSRGQGPLGNVHTGLDLDWVIANLKRIGIGENSRLTDVVGAVFSVAGRPVLLKDLVTVAAEVMNVHDRRELSSSDMLVESIAANELDLIGKIEHAAVLSRVWTEIRELPLRHRRALLLNLKDRTGDCVVSLLPALRIASIREIANVLEIGHEEFAAIWNELPWEDLRIASFLGITRQQVINLRQSARSRLSRLVNGISI